MAENNDVYVRQDVFDARMDRLEILIEKNGTELKAYIDNAINGVRGEVQQVRTDLTSEIQTLRGETNASINEVKGEIQNLRNETNASVSGLKGEIQQVRTDLIVEIQQLKAEVKVLEGRVDNVVDVVYWGVGGFGVILAAAIFVPMIMGFLKKLFTPSVTIEDVKQVMNEDRKRFVEEDIEQIVNVAVSRQLAGLAVGQRGE